MPEVVEGGGAWTSQKRRAPSEPPETRIGWTGCHATATPNEHQADIVYGRELLTTNFFFMTFEYFVFLHGHDIE